MNERTTLEVSADRLDLVRSYLDKYWVHGADFGSLLASAVDDLLKSATAHQIPDAVIKGLRENAEREHYSDYEGLDKCAAYRLVRDGMMRVTEEIVREDCNCGVREAEDGLIALGLMEPIQTIVETPDPSDQWPIEHAYERINDVTTFLEHWKKFHSQDGFFPHYEEPARAELLRLRVQVHAMAHAIPEGQE
jgi:hypothetical protein